MSLYLRSENLTVWAVTVYVAADGTPALNATPAAGVAITLELSDGVSLAWQVGVNDDGTFFNSPVAFTDQPVGVRLRDQNDQGWNVYVRGADYAFEMREINCLVCARASLVPNLIAQGAGVSA